MNDYCFTDNDLLDHEWRVRNLYYIVDKQKSQVPYQLNPIQKKLAELRKSHKRINILKARQFGISTDSLIRLLDYTMFNRNETNVILAHDRGTLEKLFSIIRNAYNCLPEGIRPVLDRGGGSKYEFRFPTRNSKIYCTIQARGDTISRLHVSEAAFVPDWQRVKATLEAVPINGNVTFETTPNGFNHFHDIWIDPKTTFKNCFFPWYLHDEYKIVGQPIKSLTDEEKEFCAKAKKLFGVTISKEQIAWRRFKKSKSELGEMFAQEYPEDDASCFLASSKSVCDLVIISQRMALAPKPIREELNGALKIFKEYDRHKNYVIGADTAEGVSSGDNSVAVLMEVETLEQVATLCSNRWKPSVFASHIVDLAKQFHTGGRAMPLVAVERNNHGHAVIQALDEISNYPNLFKDKDDKLGWLTNKVSRPVMLDAFIDGVEDGNVNLNDAEIFAEMLTLVDNGGKVEAEEGKHDDRVIASSIAVQVALSQKVSNIYDNLDTLMRV